MVFKRFYIQVFLHLYTANYILRSKSAKLYTLVIVTEERMQMIEVLLKDQQKHYCFLVAKCYNLRMLFISQAR